MTCEVELDWKLCPLKPVKSNNAAKESTRVPKKNSDTIQDKSKVSECEDPFTQHMCGDKLLNAKPHGRKMKRGTIDTI